MKKDTNIYTKHSGSLSVQEPLNHFVIDLLLVLHIFFIYFIF